MYDELIRQMMACCNGVPCEDANCGFNPKSDLDCIEQLLTRAADAIEELKKDLEQWQDYYEFWKHKAEQGLKMLQVAISNMPCWIPVTERLPEDRKTVLATVNEVVCVAFYGNYTWREVETYSIFYPTHWMPLPEPPKENKE